MPDTKNGAFFPCFIAFLLTKENAPCLKKCQFFQKGIKNARLATLYGTVPSFLDPSFYSAYHIFLEKKLLHPTKQFQQLCTVLFVSGEPCFQGRPIRFRIINSYVRYIKAKCAIHTSFILASVAES